MEKLQNDENGKSKSNETTDENPIKSIATVKHQIVRVPSDFARLQCNTDLNIPPTNWLNSSVNAYGLQQALSQSTGFSSFCMAHLFPDCVGEVDVVASAENIKRLLKLPYAANSSISMMVHRIGNTLLIDEFDVHKYLMQQEDNDWRWLRSFIYETILSRLSDPEQKVFVKSGARNEATQQRSLLSKFLYHSLTAQETIEQLDDISPPRLPIAGPLLPEPNMEENLPDPEHTKHAFNRNVVWTFEDIRMLIGTDMAIFGGGSRPCISLRLRDMQQPINVLTGIDYWLDNLMCNVPEVVMCYHLDGLVQKYEIVKTEDLPHLENSQFSPRVIRNVAQNILSFLKQNATKSGHTYWLFKGRNDDVVKLYDLTSLCPTGEFDNAAQSDENTNDGNLPDETDDRQKKDENPFTVPVAMLLYKVARNMKNSTEHMNCRQAGSIKALLDNCIKILPKEKYPQIVTSSYYLLSDLHVPNGTDPNSPKFDDDSESDTQSVYDDEKYSDDSGNGNGNGVCSDEYESPTSENVAVQNIYDTTNDSKLDKHWKHNSSPPPLTGTIDERCDVALQNIANGLNCLQYFTSNVEKLAKEKDEIHRQQKKNRIIQEEQNPNMAKSYQAIPLPYEKLQPESSSVDKTKSSTSSEISRSLPVIQTWNMHLKLLMVEKACLIYATLTEQAYQNERFGASLRFIWLSLKCQQIVTKYMSSIASQKSCLLGRAGDCFFQCAQNFNDVQKYIEQFNENRDIDEAIKNELKSEIESIDSDCEFTVADSQERLLLSSIECYEKALVCSPTKESKNELTSRLGSVQNELGVKYMHWAQTEYNQYAETKKNSGEKNSQKCECQSVDNELSDVSIDGEECPKVDEPIYMNLTRRSYMFLTSGVQAFEQINDTNNLAVLLCNLGRFMRFRAHLGDNDTIVFKKTCYESAFGHYQRALNVLESKKRCPDLWNLVHWEMSTGKFTLAKHMLDHFYDEMDEKTEQEIIELLLNALKYCDTETTGSRQIMYIVRSGLIYHNLGTIYSRAYQRESNETRKKKLLQLCRLYYDKGTKTFENCDAPIELLAIQSDRIQLQHILFEAAANNSQKKKCLKMALQIARDCIELFGRIECLEDCNADDALATVKNFQEDIQLVLKKLIRLCMNAATTDKQEIDDYKKLYSLTLKTPTDETDHIMYAKHLKNILSEIR